MMAKSLKGDNFTNRFRITGQLTTLTPLHIGTGEEILQESNNEAQIDENDQDNPKISEIVKDGSEKPYIPGSSIRGVMRHWLASILSGINKNWADTHEYHSDEFSELSQENQILKIRDEFSALEILFGTPLQQGKVEFWDANCISSEPQNYRTVNNSTNPYCYIDTSVAIDPTTGTALPHMLYNAEVVYPGITFEFNIVGQNLDKQELGILFFALQGFNSEIFPIRIGARSGRGYGRFKFILNKIYCLEAANINQWALSLVSHFGESSQMEAAIDNQAGYFSLPELSQVDQDQLIADVKREMKQEWGK